MAVTNNQLAEAGFNEVQVKVLRALINGEIDAFINGPGIPWIALYGQQTGVEAAVAAKTEIAALTSGSDAADIVAALKA